MCVIGAVFVAPTGSEAEAKLPYLDDSEKDIVNWIFWE